MSGLHDWYTVLVPKKPSKGHYDETSWCEEKFGKRWSVIDNRDGKWCCFWNGTNKPAWYRFHFKNEQDALLFSLTWL